MGNFLRKPLVLLVTFCIVTFFRVYGWTLLEQALLDVDIEAVLKAPRDAQLCGAVFAGIVTSMFCLVLVGMGLWPFAR